MSRWRDCTRTVTRSSASSARLTSPRYSTSGSSTQLADVVPALAVEVVQAALPLDHQVRAEHPPQRVAVARRPRARRSASAARPPRRGPRRRRTRRRRPRPRPRPARRRALARRGAGACGAPASRVATAEKRMKARTRRRRSGTRCRRRCRRPAPPPDEPPPPRSRRRLPRHRRRRRSRTSRRRGRRTPPTAPSASSATASSRISGRRAHSSKCPRSSTRLPPISSVGSRIRQSRCTGTETVPPMPALAPNATWTVPRIFSSSRMLPVSVRALVGADAELGDVPALTAGGVERGEQPLALGLGRGRRAGRPRSSAPAARRAAGRCSPGSP